LIVAVDARHLAARRGVAHHTRGMLAALAARFPQDAWRAVVPAGRAAAAPPGVTLVRAALPSRVLFGLSALTGRPRLDRLAGGADVAWIPAPAPVAISRSVPYVLTVHDLSWIERPHDFTRYERAWHRAGRLARLARDAAAVVTVSAATREAVLRTWRLEADRVHVVHPGITAPATDPPAAGAPAPPVPDGLPERFVLAVGALEPRKDPALLARAFARARAAGLDADLVFAGDGRLAPALRGEGVHVLGHVPDLGPLYRRALALAMPSRLEGLGLPPLEAALAGTPSAVSDLPVFAETLGDGALRVPPGDERAWADALLRLAGDEALRTRLAAAAAAAARRFSWERAADRLHAILAAAAR
jgi:glycosyltransferase involved in cell wall biosynthesis